MATISRVRQSLQDFNHESIEWRKAWISDGQDHYVMKYHYFGKLLFEYGVRSFWLFFLAKSPAAAHDAYNSHREVWAEFVAGD